jgi:hypothetical protein
VLRLRQGPHKKLPDFAFTGPFQDLWGGHSNSNLRNTWNSIHVQFAIQDPTIAHIHPTHLLTYLLDLCARAHATLGKIMLPHDRYGSGFIWLYLVFSDPQYVDVVLRQYEGSPDWMKKAICPRDAAGAYALDGNGNPALSYPKHRCAIQFSKSVYRPRAQDTMNGRRIPQLSHQSPSRTRDEHDIHRRHDHVSSYGNRDSAASSHNNRDHAPSHGNRDRAVSSHGSRDGAADSNSQHRDPTAERASLRQCTDQGPPFAAGDAAESLLLLITAALKKWYSSLPPPPCSLDHHSLASNSPPQLRS